MAAEPLGPGDGSILVRIYREGLAGRAAGHDLVLEVTRWEATFGADTIQLTADAGSLEVREASGGIKPLSDDDREDIRENIDEKVLKGAPIAFRSTQVERSGDRVVATGDLTIAGMTRPLTVLLEATDDHVGGTVTLTQSEWGIRPYRGLMGALRVRDDVEVVIDVRTALGPLRTGSA